MNRIGILIIGLFMHHAVLAQSSTVELVATWANQEIFKHAQVGVAIHEVESGNLIVGYNHEKLFVPASSLKVLTSLITIDKLGKDFQYKTKLLYDGHISDSILFGNIYLVGSGDPSLGSKRYDNRPNFQELANLIAFKIQMMGIKKIEGDIIAESTVFDTFPIALTWQWDDLGSGYGAGVWGINVNENEYDIWFNTNKQVNDVADIISTVPNIKDLELGNEVIIAAPDGDNETYIFGDPTSNKKRITGTLPLSTNPYRIKGSIPDPPKAIAQEIQFALKQRNIESHNALVHLFQKRNVYQSIEIDSFLSLPLAELARQANYHSINMYCEAFLKTLGYVKGQRGSKNEGVLQIKQYLNEKNIDFSSANIEDGSGLSARNLMTPMSISTFLSLYAKENGTIYTATLLPEVGSDGTVRRMLKNSKIKGNLWMKSGTMSRIMTYTGLMKAVSGKWISFSIMVNHYGARPYEMRQTIESLLENIYNAQ